jgi:hypothetical protein
MLMIFPVRRSIMCGATCFTIRNDPRTLIAMTRSQVSLSHSTKLRGLSFA